MGPFLLISIGSDQDLEIHQCLFLTHCATSHDQLQDVSIGKHTMNRVEEENKDLERIKIQTNI